jgi:hypothetical protein
MVEGFGPRLRGLKKYFKIPPKLVTAAFFASSVASSILISETVSYL